MGLQQRHTTVSAVQHRNPRRQVPPTPTPGFIPHFLAMAMIEQGESRAKLVLTLPNRSQSWNCSMIEQAHHCSFGLTKTLDFIPHFLAMAMIEQAHHCSFGLTKTFYSGIYHVGGASHRSPYITPSATGSECPRCFHILTPRKSPFIK